MKSTPPHDWIIAADGSHGADSYALFCRRCGETQRVVTPIAIDVYVAMAKAFGKIHARCDESRLAHAPPWDRCGLASESQPELAEEAVMIIAAEAGPPTI